MFPTVATETLFDNAINHMQSTHGSGPIVHKQQLNPMVDVNISNRLSMVQGAHHLGTGTAAYLSSVPWHPLISIFGAMVVKVGHDIQPDDIDHVGHKVQVEHGQGSQLDRASCQNGEHAQHEGVASLNLYMPTQEADQ